MSTDPTGSTNETADTNQATDATNAPPPRQRFPHTPLQRAVVIYTVVSGLILAAVFAMGGIRERQYNEIAAELAAKHDVTFVPGKWNDQRMQEWAIDGVKRECRITDAALLCLDGSVYER